MASEYSHVLSPAGGRLTAGTPRRLAGIRRWAGVGIAAQVVFVASWLTAAAWQGPRYSVVKHSISEMYAVTAPHAVFLVVVLTLCGAATIWFAVRSVSPALRPGGRAATVGSALLALSVGGLGDLLASVERVACRMADPGCTTARWSPTRVGKVDDAVSSIGVLLFVLAAFFLAAAMRRMPGWRAFGQARWTAVLVLVLAIADVADSRLGGLFERLVAAAMAAALAALATEQSCADPARRVLSSSSPGAQPGWQRSRLPLDLGPLPAPAGRTRCGSPYSRSSYPSPLGKAGTHHEQHQHHRPRKHGQRPGHPRAR